MTITALTIGDWLKVRKGACPRCGAALELLQTDDRAETAAGAGLCFAGKPAHFFGCPSCRLELVAVVGGDVFEGDKLLELLPA